MHRALAPAVAGTLLILAAACGPDGTGEHPAARDGAAPVATRPAEPRFVLHGIDLTGVGYTKGAPDAPMTIVEFSDFGCPYCGRHARETLPALEREFIATGKVRYRFVPFVMGMFPNGDAAARAAECAADQGKFWAMHDTLFAAQAEWKRSREPAALLRGYAAGIGVEAAPFAACMGQGGLHARTAMANDRATRFGIRATPTFFIDGHQLEGALPLPRFRNLLVQLAQ